jgi:AcrR family transcriptional regulator
VLSEEEEKMQNERAASPQTKQKLKDALIALCAEKSLSAITVSGVTKKAGCNRCTFYNYYDGINDLLEEIEDELFEEIEAHLRDAFANGAPQNPEEMLPILFTAFSSIGETLFILIGANGDTTFREKLYQTVRPYQKIAAGDQVDDLTLEYISVFIPSAILGLAEHWHRSKKNIPNRQFFKITQSLLYSGVSGTIQKCTQGVW